MPDEEKLLDEALDSLLRHNDGRRVLFWILSEAGIYRDAFSGEISTTNYVLGSQAVGRKIIQRMDGIDPRRYPRLLLDVADMKAMDLAAQSATDGDDEYVA